jgi:hypothetical protein
MRLRDYVDIKSTAISPRPMNKNAMPFEFVENKPLMAVHMIHVSEEASRIKGQSSMEKIFMTKEYKKFNGGYQSTLYHGLTGPSKQTIITTDKDGNKNVNVEKLG